MTHRAAPFTASWVAAAVVLAPASAVAEPGWHAMDLVTPVEEAPEYVCVVHRGAPTGKGQLRLDDAAVSKLLSAEAGGKAVTVREAPSSAAVAPETRAAWQAMQGSSGHGPCGSEQPSCAARFGLKTGVPQHVACARNAPGPPRNGKVLVVEVEDEADQPRPVEQVILDGVRVRIELGGTPAPEARLGVRIAGGHYFPGPASHRVGRRYTLRPEPRCREWQVHIPQPALPHGGLGDMQVFQSDGAEEQPLCQHPASTSFSVALPTSAPARGQRIRVELASTTNLAPLVFAGERTQPAPPGPIALQPEVVTFHWDAPCEYASEQCPRARIPAAGMRCEPSVLPPAKRKARPGQSGHLSCAYRCTSEKGATRTFSWPAEVRFRGPATSSWTGRLHGSGETLRSYVPVSKRSFPVRFAWEDRSARLLQRPGDRIRYVALSTPAGRVHHLEVGDGQRVTLPGARCGDTFEVRVVGDREFGTMLARIEDGWLVVPDPTESANGLQVGGKIGGGFILPASRFGLPGPEGLESRAYGTAQVSVRLQPDPHVEGSVFEPRAYEIHLSYIIAQQPYFPVHAPDEHVEDDADYLPFNRWLLEAMPTWQIGQRTQLGLGMGVGLGFPVLTKDEAAIGKSRLFFVPLSALGRIQVSRLLSVEGSFRVVGPERVYRYEPSPFFAGTPERTEDTLWSGMLGLVGVRLWL